MLFFTHINSIFTLMPRSRRRRKTGRRGKICFTFLCRIFPPKIYIMIYFDFLFIYFFIINLCLMMMIKSMASFFYIIILICIARICSVCSIFLLAVASHVAYGNKLCLNLTSHHKYMKYIYVCIYCIRPLQSSFITAITKMWNSFTYFEKIHTRIFDQLEK